VRQGQPLRLELDVTEQKQIDVQGSRPVPGTAEDPATLGLHGLADVEQLLGLEGGREAYGRVEEVGLVEDLANGLGFVDRRDRLDRDATFVEQRDGRPQVAFAVADIGAQAQVTGPRQLGSSSSS
jgi:hypothetical protein